MEIVYVFICECRASIVRDTVCTGPTPIFDAFGWVGEFDNVGTRVVGIWLGGRKWKWNV